MKIFKSKVFIVLLCVAIVLTTVPAVLSAMGHTGIVRNAFLTVTYPVRWLFTTMGRGLSGFSAYFTEYNDIKAENESLREELASAKDKLDAAEVALAENEWLRSFFGILDTEVKYELVSAGVVGYDAENTRTVYVLDKGSVNGVAVDMAVITEDGAVGCVTEVGLNWCKVTAMLEDGMAVGAYLLRTGEHGIVKGDYSMLSDMTCRMTMLPESSDVKEGDVVYTSGVGSIYPEGIPIGRVLSVTDDPTTRTKSAVIKPYAEFGNIKKVMIVRSFEVIPVGETEGETTEVAPD